jgi:hypothetical protein
LAAPALAAIPAHPGMLNYVEGQASINGRAVTNSNVGTADVGQGQVIETGQGKAEILLTPGVFLRLGDNSAIRMDSNGLTDTRVSILRGRAMIEADNLLKQNNITVTDQSAVTRLEKNGVYSFSASPSQVATFDGKAKVTENDQNVSIGKGHEADLNAPLHAVKFDVKADENDPLYQWSKVRSSYLAEANIDTARTVVVNGGWYGPGWYWDPWFAMYSWIPGNGIFWNPFGWGFYSPVYVWSAPRYLYHGYAGYRGYPAYRGGFAGRSIAVAPRAYGFSGSGFAHAGGGFGGTRGGGFRR